MKDIYELLNNIDIDTNEFEEMPVNDIEKAKVKKVLKGKIRRKSNWKRKSIAAASIGVVSLMGFGILFPSYAKNLPLVGDIFKALDRDNTGMYDDYKKYANEVNITKESKGIRVTINDAIFDGKTINLTYTIESDKDLGESPSFGGAPIDIKGGIISGITGSSYTEKINDNTYIGHDVYTISDLVENPKDSIVLELNIRDIVSENEEIKGRWNFELALKAQSGDVQKINKSIEKEGITVEIKEIDINPMSMSIVYSQKVAKEVNDKWDNVNMSIEVRDDLGNIYMGEGNGGSGDIYNNMTWSSTFEKTNPEATKLIITPKIELSTNTSENSGGVEFDNKGNVKDITTKKTGKGERETMTFDDIVIDITK